MPEPWTHVKDVYIDRDHTAVIEMRLGDEVVPGGRRRVQYMASLWEVAAGGEPCRARLCTTTWVIDPERPDFPRSMDAMVKRFLEDIHVRLLRAADSVKHAMEAQ